ncbi:hypothetical protein E4U21_001748 [Claviceps maximensis]|nr:hypothetical protein E4U21_001748 [Claviceps maximensis]
MKVGFYISKHMEHFYLAQLHLYQALLLHASLAGPLYRINTANTHTADDTSRDVLHAWLKHAEPSQSRV